MPGRGRGMVVALWTQWPPLQSWGHPAFPPGSPCCFRISRALSRSWPVMSPASLHMGAAGAKYPTEPSTNWWMVAAQPAVAPLSSVTFLAKLRASWRRVLTPCRASCQGPGSSGRLGTGGSGSSCGYCPGRSAPARCRGGPGCGGRPGTGTAGDGREGSRTSAGRRGRGWPGPGLPAGPRRRWWECRRRRRAARRRAVRGPGSW